MLTIVGGTYYEVCLEPYDHRELYGSGLRAACALSLLKDQIILKSCIGKNDVSVVKAICDGYSIKADFTQNDNTVTFFYEHPLALPDFYPDLTNSKISLPNIEAENILYYGMNEATVNVKGKYVVYDPQNWVSFNETLSTAEHLAIILNYKEALLLSGKSNEDTLHEVGKSLLESENAEVIVIKNGAHGALVVEANNISEIPVFQTTTVWPIGSGDIFSAVFAWQWILEKKTPGEAAMLASKYVAHYVQTELYPLPTIPDNLPSLKKPSTKRKIYLAGPFFTMSQRWLIHELRYILLAFGNEVFSPLHDVGIIGNPNNIYEADIKGLKDCEIVLAILNELDPGTLFEIGFAKAIGKKIIAFAENYNEADLLMLIGANCEIVNDFSSAVYRASW